MFQSAGSREPDHGSVTTVQAAGSFNPQARESLIGACKYIIGREGSFNPQARESLIGYETPFYKKD